MLLRWSRGHALLVGALNITSEYLIKMSQEIPKEVADRIKTIADEFRQQVMTKQAAGVQANILDEFIGFASQRIARLEVVCDGLLQLYNEMSSEANDTTTSSS